MKNDERVHCVLRESILKLLSEAEVASVSTAERAVCLADGDDYLDMQQLFYGVRHAPEKSRPRGLVLPRKAVREETWSRILDQLSAPRGSRSSMPS